MDLTNAFNTVEREPILSYLAEEFPEALPWAAWSLCSEAPLLSADQIVSSRTGVQQGDPLGPLFFACGIQKAILQIQQEHPSSFHVYYLDDGTIVGPLSDLDVALSKLTERLPHLGLHVNLVKTKLFTRHPIQSFPNLSQLIGLSSEGLEALGTPIGTPSFVQQHVERKFTQAANFCEKVKLVSNSQVAFALLRFCAGTCRIVHLAKVVPPDCLQRFLWNLDEAMVATAQHCGGLVLNHVAREQLFLPTRLGGVGFMSSLRTAPPAFVTTLQRFLAEGSHTLKVPDQVTSLARIEYPSALQALERASPPTASQALQWLDQPTAFSSVHDDFSSLKWWNDLLAQSVRKSLLDSVNARDRARLLCQGDGNSGCWLEPCPSESLGLRLSSSEFSILLKWWLGLPVMPDAPGCSCPLCGDAADIFGDHALACRRGGFYPRHTAVRSFLWHLGTAAGLRTTCEVGLGGLERPADVLFSHWKGGAPLAVDAVVVHPLNPSTPFSQVQSGEESLVTAEQEKRNKSESACQAAGVQFAPFALSTFGRMGDTAQSIFHDLVASMPDSRQGPEQSKFMQQLQLALKREIARMLLQGALRP